MNSLFVQGFGVNVLVREARFFQSRSTSRISRSSSTSWRSSGFSRCSRGPHAGPTLALLGFREGNQVVTCVLPVTPVIFRPHFPFITMKRKKCEARGRDTKMNFYYLSTFVSVYFLSIRRVLFFISRFFLNNVSLALINI